MQRKLRGSLVVPALCSVLAGQAKAQVTVDQGQKQVFALVGNHSMVVVRYPEDGSNRDRIVAELRWENDTFDLYVWQPAAAVITVKSSDTATEVIHQRDQDPIAYDVALRRLRDLLAYASGPDRFESRSHDENVVTPELNNLIQMVNQSLVAPGREDIVCQLVADGAASETIVVSGGAFGELVNPEQKVTKVWVRKGYKLVLATTAGLSMEADTKLAVALGEERRSFPELPFSHYDRNFSPLVSDEDGTTYELTGSEVEGQVRSFICRPDLR